MMFLSAVEQLQFAASLTKCIDIPCQEQVYFWLCGLVLSMWPIGRKSGEWNVEDFSLSSTKYSSIRRKTENAVAKGPVLIRQLRPHLLLTSLHPCRYVRLTHCHDAQNWKSKHNYLPCRKERWMNEWMGKWTQE